MTYLHSVLTLIKYKVSIAVTFTAITGYIVYSGVLQTEIIYLIISMFLLAGGSGGLNECQESKYDARMKRTMNRPIPSGELSMKEALIISILLITIGLTSLYFFFGLITALLGLFNVVCYNLIYTKLKRVFAYAVVPGSLVGAVPVFMGWTAAGGFIFEQTIIYIAFFIFIWQIPHFWLLMLKYSDEYENAGFPTINNKFELSSLKRIIFSWIIASCIISVLIPFFLQNFSWFFFSLVCLLNFVFIFFYIKVTFISKENFQLRKSFMSINIYMFIFMLMLIMYHLY